MPAKPDIVMIITDQQRFDTIRALGASHMDTPNLDRLVERGVTFTNCQVTAPSCVPCRASLFTGYYPHTNGVHANGQAWGKTWVSDLAAAGYHTVNIGKMHTIPYDTPAGFQERYVVGEQRPLHGGPLVFRRVGQGARGPWPEEAAARALSRASRLQGAARRLHLGPSRRIFNPTTSSAAWRAGG